MSRNLWKRVYRGLEAGSFLTVAAITTTFAALILTPPACAQSSLDSSSAPIADYALPPPDGTSLAEPSTPDDAITDDSAADDATPAEAPPNDTVPAVTAPAKPRAKAVAATDSGSGSVAAHSGWDRVGDADAGSESEDPDNKVLELPQVVQSGNAEASADNSPPSDDDDAGQTAQDAGQTAQDAGQTAQDAGQTAQDAGFPSPDQLGSVEDYQDQNDSAVMGVYVVPIPLGAVGINPYAMNTFQSTRIPVSPGFLPGFVPGMPFGTTAVRPLLNGMNSAVWPTSPMFPRSSMRFSGGMFGHRR